MDFDEYLGMKKKNSMKFGFKPSKKIIQNDQNEEKNNLSRDPTLLPLQITEKNQIDLQFVESYLIEVVKHNKISVSVGRLLKEWFVEKSNLQGTISNQSDLEIDIDDLELLLSRMSKSESKSTNISDN